MKPKHIREVQLKDACITNEVNCEQFNLGSFRLTKDGYHTIDYYPKSQKCFYHTSQTWEQVKDITAFVKFQFNPKVKGISSPVDNRAKALKAINNAREVTVVESNGVVTIVCKLT